MPTQLINLDQSLNSDISDSASSGFVCRLCRNKMIARSVFSLVYFSAGLCFILNFITLLEQKAYQSALNAFSPDTKFLVYKPIWNISHFLHDPDEEKPEFCRNLTRDLFTDMDRFRLSLDSLDEHLDYR